MASMEELYVEMLHSLKELVGEVRGIRTELTRENDMRQHYVQSQQETKRLQRARQQELARRLQERGVDPSSPEYAKVAEEVQREMQKEEFYRVAQQRPTDGPKPFGEG